MLSKIVIIFNESGEHISTELSTVNPYYSLVHDCFHNQLSNLITFLKVVILTFDMLVL